jgi:hypothetical protein
MDLEGFIERYGAEPGKDDLTILAPKQDDPTEQVLWLVFPIHAALDITHRVYVLPAHAGVTMLHVEGHRDGRLCHAAIVACGSALQLLQLIYQACVATPTACRSRVPYAYETRHGLVSVWALPCPSHGGRPRQTATPQWRHQHAVSISACCGVRPRHTCSVEHCDVDVNFHV